MESSRIQIAYVCALVGMFLHPGSPHGTGWQLKLLPLCPTLSNTKKYGEYISDGSASFKDPYQKFHSHFCLHFIIYNSVLWAYLVAT